MKRTPKQKALDYCMYMILTSYFKKAECKSKYWEKRIIPVLQRTGSQGANSSGEEMHSYCMQRGKTASERYLESRSKSIHVQT